MRAVVHHHDAVGHRERLLLVVGDEDGGDAQALLQAADLAAQAHAHARVERGERLVEQQQPGRGGERARDRDALLLAAGELARDISARCRAGRRAPAAPSRAPRASRLRHAAVDQPVGDVVGDASGWGTARRTGTRCRSRASSAAAREMSRPACTMRPAVCTSSPAMMRSSVVLPQPEGPRKQTSSPGCTARLTSLQRDEARRTPCGCSRTRNSGRRGQVGLKLAGRTVPTAVARQLTNVTSSARTSRRSASATRRGSCRGSSRRRRSRS